MAGEMSRDDVTREDFPLHFAIADAFAGSTVEPFDVYQGPYVQLSDGTCLWISGDEDVEVWNARTGLVSESFSPFEDNSPFVAACAALTVAGPDALGQGTGLAEWVAYAYARAQLDAFFSVRGATFALADLEGDEDALRAFMGDDYAGPYGGALIRSASGFHLGAGPLDYVVCLYTDYADASADFSEVGR